MVVFTVAVGFLLGARGSAHPIELVDGDWRRGAGGGWGHGVEPGNGEGTRLPDAADGEKADPSGRLGSVESAVFATVMTVIGLGMLLAGPHPIAAAVALATFLLYVLAYTPLKPVTTLNTAVGAIPGALPPVIGWAAATGELGIEPWTLFLIMFLWQFPHFLAIAWIYREDYTHGWLEDAAGGRPDGADDGPAGRGLCAGARAGFALAGGRGSGRARSTFVGALALRRFYLAAAIRFSRDVNETTARKLLRASFVHLPLTLLLLLLNPLPV